jgi:hypothetical protein|eukprot:SAG25_NODE_1234_length_3531_cov_5.241841_3_plen_53_part_00
MGGTDRVEERRPGTHSRSDAGRQRSVKEWALGALEWDSEMSICQLSNGHSVS